MSFKRNILASYASQICVTLVSIFILPLYLSTWARRPTVLLVFFQCCRFGLLEIRLSPTLARETARSRAGAVKAIDFRRLVRALTIVFVIVAQIGSASLFFSAPYVADEWLNVDHMLRDIALLSVQLMALGIGLRWLSGLARARIIGSESFVWLSVFNSLMATIRFG